MPPLTVHLLNSYYDNANTSNKLLSSYLNHYVATPVLQHGSTQDELLPGLGRERSGSMVDVLGDSLEGCKRASYSVAEGITHVGITSTTGLIYGSTAVIGLGAEAVTAGAKGGFKVGAKVAKGGASVVHGGASVASSVVQGGASVVGGVVSAAALQDNVRKLKSQLAQLEGQLAKIPVPTRPSMRVRRASQDEMSNSSGGASPDHDGDGSPETTASSPNERWSQDGDDEEEEEEEEESESVSPTFGNVRSSLALHDDEPSSEEARGPASTEAGGNGTPSPNKSDQDADHDDDVLDAGAAASEVQLQQRLRDGLTTEAADGNPSATENPSPPKLVGEGGRLVYN